MRSMDTIVIAAGICVVAAIAVIAAALYLRRPKQEPEDEGRKVTEDHVIAKMDTILRYQNADRP